MSVPPDMVPERAERLWPFKTVSSWAWSSDASAAWVAALAALVLLVILYHQSVAYMVHIWSTDENYGHGFFVPLISLYLMWERRHELAESCLTGALRGSWGGFILVLAGLALYFIGEFATLYILLHLSLWLVLVGLLLAAIGTTGIRIIAFPLLYLLTMIPLPHFLYQGISGQLQLISSSLGVGCLQLVGVTAFREGNIIDLGPIQLQVVEACSGLRYLFPLASLALLCSYLFKDRLWKRIVLFLSSFPISIVLNGFRIGMIGVLVEAYGEGAAEGFAHFFEGWLIFIASLGLLFLEIRLLGSFGTGGTRRPWSSLFALGAGAALVRSESPVLKDRMAKARLAPAYILSMAVLLSATVASAHVVSPDEAPPPRQPLLDFPLHLGDWAGQSLVMEQAYIDVLRFDDYMLADYRLPSDAPVNFYVAYYRSQKKSQSAHSPRTCIPGGGWEITSLRDLEIKGAAAAKEPIVVNRAVIQKGDQKQLVLYWFQQRGRVLANEYLVKWYLFWDALTKHRTDGALVRLTTAVGPGENEAAAERRLLSLSETVQPILGRYVPD